MKRLIMLTLIVALCVASFAGIASVQAQSGNTWRVDFYPNTDWAGAPVYTQYVSFLNFNWGTAAPGPNMPNANWTLRATTTAFFYAGTYRFTVQADDEVVLLVDGITYLNTIDKGQSGKTFVVDVPMYQGNHGLQVDFRQYTGAAYLYVNWEYLKGDGGGGTPPPPPTPPPSQCTQPNSASSVQTQYGDYTPCIQQNLHQSKCFQSDGAWNSPNMGSIETEPKIIVWGQCKPDSVTTMVLYACEDPQEAKCSKTAAGWFEN